MLEPVKYAVIQFCGSCKWEPPSISLRFVSTDGQPEGQFWLKVVQNESLRMKENLISYCQKKYRISGFSEHGNSDSTS
jgi:hypothetical protein